MQAHMGMWMGEHGHTPGHMDGTGACRWTDMGTRAHSHANTRTCIQTHIHTRRCANTSVHAVTPAHTHALVQSHAQSHPHIYTVVQTHRNTHADTCGHLCSHTCTPMALHTQMPVPCTHIPTPDTCHVCPCRAGRWPHVLTMSQQVRGALPVWSPLMCARPFWCSLTSLVPMQLCPLSLSAWATTCWVSGVGVCPGALGHPGVTETYGQDRHWNTLVALARQHWDTPLRLGRGYPCGSKSGTPC